MDCVVVFGGTGNIGMQFAEHLLSATRPPARIILADLVERRVPDYCPMLASSLKAGKTIYRCIDVRKPIKTVDFRENRISLIANFAAVHREPGHDLIEYYETNIRGAEHVTRFAEQTSCDEIIFTSSIAPYGSTEQPKNELSLTVPETPYGGSKLAAEKIHQIWQVADRARRLVIVRPGVVFGPGENANVYRMITAIRKNYFFYCNNQAVIKAGGYVKELCYTMTWALERTKNNPGEQFVLYNFSCNPVPSIQDYVHGILKAMQRRKLIPNVPYAGLKILSLVLEATCKPLKIKHPFSPVRVRKLIISNNIMPEYLKNSGYTWQFTLDEALQDWLRDCPEDWMATTSTQPSIYETQKSRSSQARGD